MPTFSKQLEQTLHRSLRLANERKHKYSTLEHLLLALVSDADAAAVMKACAVDLDKLTGSLQNYLDTEFENLAMDDDNEDAKPTAGFQRVIQRAVIHVQSSGREEVNGANVLIAIFAERESHAAYFLQEQDMTRFDAINFISEGIVKRPGLHPLPHALLLSDGKDRALEDWLQAVLSSAGFQSDLARDLIRPGDHIVRVLSNAGSPPGTFIALITPNFRKTPLYEVLARESNFNSIVSTRPIIPLVVGQPVTTGPFGEIAQVSLPGQSAEATCEELFSAIGYSGSYDSHPDLLASALRQFGVGSNRAERSATAADSGLSAEVRAKEPEPEPGPEFDITNRGLSLRASHPPQTPFDDRTQRNLHERLQKAAPLLARASRGSNTPAHQGLALVASEYADLIAQPLDALDVVSVWAVGAGLLANRDAFARAHDNRTMTEPLEPAHFALLQQVAEVHGGFILGFPEARELADRADQSRISGEAMEKVVSLARGIIDELRNSRDEVDVRTRNFLAAVEEGLVEPGWKITRAGYAAYVVTRNALIAIGRLLNWANSSFSTIVGGIALNHVDPGLVHTQFWIEFVVKNGRDILAFAEPFPELKIWLHAQIEAAKADREMRKSKPG
jgi:Clp amino terminal domain, pathogenicity island component